MIPGSVKNIGNYIFTACASLKLVVIPNSVRSIGERIFSGCWTHANFVLPDGLIGNRVNYAITPEQNVIGYSDWFNKWKNDNDLAGNSYSDQENLFLYQLQNIETFKPSWNEIIRDYAQIGLDDIIKFSGNKNVCRPSWNKDDGNGDGNENGDIYRDAQNLGNNNTCLESREAQFSQFGEVISVWFTGRDSANFACVAKSKDMRPVESMNLTSESPVFSSCHLENEKSDMVNQETLKDEQSNKRQKK